MLYQLSYRPVNECIHNTKPQTPNQAKSNPTPPTPPTAFGESPHRVSPNLGAETGETRFKGDFLVNPYLFGKDREKGGGRTEIEVFPVRVYPKRGAETP